MPLIHLTTFIEAPGERVFDLSRSVELHRHSMSAHEEKIMDGTMTGLMSLEDTVTWKAKHFFKERIMKVKVSALRRPDFFMDEQVTGPFALMKHEHYFKPAENGTIMIDQFRFETPNGFAGTLFNKIYLEKYLTRLLTARNRVIKKTAEGNQWKQYL
jgi:ligand-binding SRPBCC domain-containing protein